MFDPRAKTYKPRRGCAIIGRPFSECLNHKFIHQLAWSEAAGAVHDFEYVLVGQDIVYPIRGREDERCFRELYAECLGGAV